MKYFLNLLTISILFVSYKSLSEDLKPYTVFLKPGTVLTSLSDKSDVILEKGLFAKVLELDPRVRDLFYVFDKDGLAKYQTTSLGIEEIAGDTRLLPDINAEKIYPPKSVFNAQNAMAEFDSQFNIHIDNIQLSNLNDIYNDQIQNVMSARYELRTLYITHLPVNFGLSLNYQSAYWKNDSEQVKISILSFGPHFQYKLKESNDFKLNLLAGAEVAPIYQGRSSHFIDEYSASLFDFGLEGQWQSPIGIVSLGTHLRHHEVALSKTDRTNTTVVPKEFSLNSYGLSIGYKIEWDL